MKQKNKASNVAAFESLTDQKRTLKDTSSTLAINDSGFGGVSQVKTNNDDLKRVITIEIYQNGKKLPPIEDVTTSGTDVIKILDAFDFASVIPNFKPFTDFTNEDRFILMRLCVAGAMPERGDDPVDDTVRSAQCTRVLAAMLEGKYLTALRLGATCNGSNDITRRCADIQEKTGAVIVSMRPVDLEHVEIIRPWERFAECERNRYYLIGAALDETEDAYKALRYGGSRDQRTVKRIVAARNERVRDLIRRGVKGGAA